MYSDGKRSILPVWMAGICCLIFSSGQSHHLASNKAEMVASAKRLRIVFAGTPPTIVYGGTSFVTMARVPMIAPSPMVTPDRITAS